MNNSQFSQRGSPPQANNNNNYSNVSFDQQQNLFGGQNLGQCQNGGYQNISAPVGPMQGDLFYQNQGRNATFGNYNGINNQYGSQLRSWPGQAAGLNYAGLRGGLPLSGAVGFQDAGGQSFGRYNDGNVGGMVRPPSPGIVADPNRRPASPRPPSPGACGGGQPVDPAGSFNGGNYDGMQRTPPGVAAGGPQISFLNFGNNSGGSGQQPSQINQDGCPTIRVYSEAPTHGNLCSPVRQVSANNNLRAQVSPSGNACSPIRQVSPNGSFRQPIPQISPIGSFRQPIPQISPIGSFRQPIPQISPNGSFRQPIPQISPIGSFRQPIPQISPIGSFRQPIPQGSPNASLRSQNAQIPPPGNFPQPPIPRDEGTFCFYDNYNEIDDFHVQQLLQDYENIAGPEPDCAGVLPDQNPGPS